MLLKFGEALSEGGIEATRELLAPDVEFSEPPEQPGATTFYGREQVIEGYGRWSETWESQRSEIGRVVDMEDTVLVLTTEHLLGRDGIQVDQPCGTVFELRNGKIVRFASYWDQSTALEAVGLSGSAMSQQNVEIVRALQPQPEWDLVTLLRDETTAAAMLEGFAPRFHDDFEAFAPGALMESRRYTGMEGLRDLWLEWLEPWESYRVEIENVIDAGDDVVVLTRDYGRRPGMTAEVSVLGAAVWTVRDGKIARAGFYAHRGEALEAVGLSE